MKNNAHSVNIKLSDTTQKGYHHGDLRAAAVQSGLKMLENKGADNISLRAVARHVGVSANALYRHFLNKEGLLAALSKAAAEQLAAAQSAAMKSANDGVSGLEAMGIAYVEFAIANPALFRILFRNAPPADMLDSDLHEVSAAMRGLREQVALALPADVAPQQRSDTVLRALSMVHGLACLILDQQVPYDPDMIKRVVTLPDLFE